MADPQFNYVQLLLHADGVDDSTTFTDSSGTPKTIGAVGTVKLATETYKFGTASLDCTTTGDCLNVTNVAALRPGTGDYCVEFWAYPDATGTEKFVFTLGINEAGGFLLGCSTAEIRFRDSGTADLIATQTINDGDHIACVRTGGQKKIFINGTQVGGNQASSSDVNSTTAIQVGSCSGISSGFRFTGHLDDVRYTVGAARYTANFTAPTAAHPDSLPTATGFSSTQFGTPNLMLGVATGFSSTQFGTPFAIYDKIEDATGFSSTQFGSGHRLITAVADASSLGPTAQFGTPTNIPNAIGFRSTVFGTPNLVLSASGIAPTTTFGTPTYRQFSRATTLGLVTRFGNPYYPHLQTCEATGTLVTQFGLAISLAYVPDETDRIVQPLHFRSTRFGTPTYAGTFTGAATGLAGTAFGASAAAQSTRSVATGDAPATAFGTPTVTTLHRASGFACAVLGAPTLVMTAHASGSAPATRFGTPAQWGPHRVYPQVPGTRFGRATGFARFNKAATGFTGTQFGTPAAKHIHRATQTPPGTRFGRPQLERGAAP